ncbi:MAG: hypothetical protein AAF683_10590 [Pseudomonadota bacterium]
MAHEQRTDKQPKKKKGWLGAAIVCIGSFAFATLPEPDPLDMSPEAVAEREQQKLERQRQLAEIARQREICDVSKHRSTAIVTARYLVKERLNDPRSARFPRAPSQLTVDQSTCTFAIAGEYSAKNAFGGRVRGSYAMNVQVDADGNSKGTNIIVR